MDDKKKELTFRVPTPEEIEPDSTMDWEAVKNRTEASKQSILSKMVDVLQVNQEIVNTNSLEIFAATFIQAINEISIDMKPMLEGLKQLVASISEAVIDLSIPTISDKRKQELLASHKQWGAFGWTWFMDAPMYFYDETPLSMEDANKRVKSLCSTQGVDLILDDLRKQNIRKEDLESAIYCYKNKQYKACSLILFGLIDAKMIRKQPKPKSVKDWRKVGKSAVIQLKKQSKDGQNIQTLYMMLHYVNLFACLETFFERGDDFKHEPPTVNRNFVTHGMNRRPVRQRDCIQLFLLLNNLSYFLQDN